MITEREPSLYDAPEEPSLGVDDGVELAKAALQAWLTAQIFGDEQSEHGPQSEALSAAGS